ncbi:unnamed protein product [Gemmata obscuriglobus UQM 2246]|nr:unnamed protein product [Gemmata obscuriglobus UQM 2246]
MRRSRKPIYPQGYRGFESLPLRYNAICVKTQMAFFMAFKRFCLFRAISVIV